jgi:hypothetical protein
VRGGAFIDTLLVLSYGISQTSFFSVRILATGRTGLNYPEVVSTELERRATDSTTKKIQKYLPMFPHSISLRESSL